MRHHTEFEPCPKHAPSFARETRYRRAEFFVEGGPYNSRCGGGLCQMRPGVDFYNQDFVTAYDAYTGAIWPANRIPERTTARAVRIGRVSR
jgi:hypothetical protein